MYALVLAGGVGTRLWPLSRKKLPKQLLPLIGNKTMVQATVERVLPITPVEQIFFATSQEYAQMIEEQVPKLPPTNIVLEPSPKSTAPCIGLSALHMQQLDPDAVMASLHSDHYIADEEGFRQALLAAEEVAKEGYLVTLGITPNKPETGYGYLERGSDLGTFNRHPVFSVNRFLEKPDLETAERFLASGAYYWNSGIFIWQISDLMQAYQKHMPDFFGQLDRMSQALVAGEPIEPIWQAVTPESIDVGILEKADKVAMVPVDIGWNDVGSWAAIHEINQADTHDNVLLGDDCLVLDTKGSLVYGHKRFIATIGLENVIIVDTDEALVVCAKDKAQDIKRVVSWLEENDRSTLL
ncbi:MAG: sugar phosphate nucleotidyltransferase [Anaerolineae bacterium]|nr:sugar phosphate nucleotidyltransferase [Anaerolineae bacterium]